MNDAAFSWIRIGVLAAILAGSTSNSVAQTQIATSEAKSQLTNKLADNVVLRKMRSASGDRETANATLEKLIGRWHQSPENFSAAAKQWMSENRITDFYDTFSWGTNKAWIDFGDYRVVDNVAEKTGVGMISWHTGFSHLRFRESGAEGGFVDGMIEIKDENTFIRHFEFFAPNGEVSYYSDTWTFDPEHPECFEWQSTSYEGEVPTIHPARKFCRAN